MISSDDPDSPFSEKGDSGAVLLTILDEKHHGIGIIYVDDQGANYNITERETIAIFLIYALDQFTSEKKYDH